GHTAGRDASRVRLLQTTHENARVLEDRLTLRTERDTEGAERLGRLERQDVLVARAEAEVVARVREVEVVRDPHLEGRDLTDLEIRERRTDVTKLRSLGVDQRDAGDRRAAVAREVLDV